MDDSKPTLLFIDEVCPRPYDPSNIDERGVGGTEQTMVTLADGLATTGLFNVVVEQHNRKEDRVQNVTYSRPGETRRANWVVALRDPRTMLGARQRFTNAKVFLYSHDLADSNLGQLFANGVFRDSGCAANICVSHWHRTQTIEVLRPWGYTGQFRTHSIYNPLSADATYVSGSYDRNKLLWLASPHKGLARAYELLPYLVRLNPEFKLYVTNPGYLEDLPPDETLKNHVVALGTLPHFQVIEHLRSSLCLFYPNTVFPETFGKVMAEANAVGTPVLTSPIGASREVLDSHPGQIVDCRDTEAVLRRVMKWYEGERPIVRGRSAFKLTSVVSEWVRVLEGVR